MTDKIVILVTVPSKEEGHKIARHLVESRLAACVNVTGAIESFYRWKGEITQDQEYQIFIKTTRGMFPEIQAAISRLHSYQTPEIICLPIIDGSREYLQWVNESVKPADPVSKDNAE
ncbi:MAG: divalent-cation tolerance protein CutA [Terriglobia bacterium]